MNSILTESVISLNDYFENNQVDAFFQLVDQVIEQLTDEEAHEPLIHVVLCKSALYFNLSHLTLASQVLADYASYIESHGSIIQKIRYYNTLAAIQGKNNETEQMFRYLELAKQLAEQHNDDTYVVKIYHNLSVYYFKQQQFEASLLYAKKSLAYFAAKQPQAPQYSRILMNYAKVLIAMNRLDEASHVLETAKIQLGDEKSENRIAWIKTYVQWLEKDEQLEKAYDVLAYEIAQQPEQHGWNKELYELLCPLSKKTQSLKRYLNDLQQFKKTLDFVNAQFINTQLHFVQQYVDIDHFREIAWRDPLTNVYNRKYLEEHYGEFCAQYPQHTVIMFDMDHFKIINDTFGHATGDQAIQQIADAVNELFKQHHALFVRYGGDEFVACVRYTTFRALTPLLEALQALLTKQTLVTSEGVLHLTMSIGAFRVQQPCTLREALIRADRALYVAKEQGRNHYKIE